MRPDPILVYQNAPLDELLAILLRQYRRPLAGHGIHLSDAEIEALARDLAARTEIEEKISLTLRAALAGLIEESMRVLSQWNLTFAQSLDTEIAAIPGWQSTAEFLDIAQEKANAELRISTGAALLTSLGDTRFAPELLALVERGDHDLDAVIARRVLLLASGISPDDPAWLDSLRAWVAQM